MLVENFSALVVPSKKNPAYPEKFRTDRYSINGIKFIDKELSQYLFYF
ncbi:hypothetical protein C7972_103164 [Arenibacter sp. ARW7G5Y1]|nr:hypothetical protein C7972_103164 [Arenibacter sp. ARW7G5Y1]